MVIDIGNSFSKVGLFDKNILIEYKEFRLFSVDDIKPFFYSKTITNSIISNVSSYDKKVFEFLNMNSNLVLFDAEIKLPFKNKYGSVETIGNDRIALVSQASRLYPHKNVLVIDSGSCITYDFLNDKNEYLGGGISPGLNMKLKALNNQTARLPLVKKTQIKYLIGKSTETSILSGVINGTLGEINYIIEEYKKRYKKIVIILTGGDLNFLFNHIKNGILADPKFLLSGLNILIELNKKEWINI